MGDNINQEPTDFMKETIKQRPLNRRKLVRRTIITAAMAVVFGTIACLTFLVLEPLISNSLYPEEEPEAIVFPEEVDEEEILPEDMIADDSQMQPEPTDPPVLEDEQIAQVLSEMKLGAEDYMSLFSGINEVAREVQKSMVTVTGVTSDVSWLENEYENEGVVSGVIVADNGRELLILANVSSIENAESLIVTFSDGSEYRANIKKKDDNTNLAILTIFIAAIKPDLLETAIPVSLGTSASANLAGSPIVALGRPMGTQKSICFGTITSLGNAVPLPDSDYQMLTTDIYGSHNASGIVINLRGQLIGFIDMSHNVEDMGNLVSAIGISELKKVIERLSNDKDIAYLGIYGTSVTKEANATLGVPFGAYITEINMDSPAMLAGIQSGDVITRIDGEEISSYSDVVKKLLAKDPEENIILQLMRQGPDGYTEMDVTVTLGFWPE